MARQKFDNPFAAGFTLQVHCDLDRVLGGSRVNQGNIVQELRRIVKNIGQNRILAV